MALSASYEIESNFQLLMSLFPRLTSTHLWLKAKIKEEDKSLLTDFLTNDTNPYPLDFNVCGSRTTRQSLHEIISNICIHKRLRHRKLNHRDGLTKCLRMAGKLLSTFAFRFRAKDRQQKCDSVLPRKKIYGWKITRFLWLVCSYVEKLKWKASSSISFYRIGSWIFKDFRAKEIPEWKSLRWIAAVFLPSCVCVWQNDHIKLSSSNLS